MCWVQDGGQGFQFSLAAIYSNCQALQLPFPRGPVDPPGTCSAPVEVGGYWKCMGCVLIFTLFSSWVI